MNEIVPIKLASRLVKPHKAIISPDLLARNVLTNSHWDFVELWLRKKRKKNALFYWNQAREFNNASIGLPIQSSPLLHYYSFMNATKALLCSKNIDFNEYRGIQHHYMKAGSKKVDLANEGVKIKK